MWSLLSTATLIPPVVPMRTFRPSILFAILALSVCCSTSSAQIVRNGEFEPDLSWWFGFGNATIELTDDAFQGASACQVSDRTFFWEGAAQSLDETRLTPGTDYHIQAWVKLPPEQSGIMGIVLYQRDDRGERALRLGEVAAGPDEWTLLEGGFTYDPHGDIDYLFLNFPTTSDGDAGNYDYQIDSVTITENDWREEADQRTELIRKRDVQLTFVDSDGEPQEGIEVSAVQISHAFPFGSAIHTEAISNPIYQDFFTANFDVATVEFQTQWFINEEVPGIEDYSLADATLEFCEENNIDTKGHAIFWGQESTRPEWLTDLSDSELEAAMETRISSAVNRYGSRLFGWDVNNEMLHNFFFMDRLGESIRTWAFTRARELNPDIQLFLNEFDLTLSAARSERYRALYDSLIEGGAEVSGVGFQSHFDGRMSPKGLELALEEFADSGAPIWFTEYDSTHPDPVQRGASLEDFYRYAFSRPETEAIIMWGFWAGTHWRGPDASIIDLDWTINAAGETYFELMDEWTTETEGSSDAEGNFEFRGFHGNYVVTSTDSEGVVNHHLVLLPEGTTPSETLITVSSVDQSLTIHGTELDDIFRYDMSQPDVIEHNGEVIALSEIPDFDQLLIDGQGGTDQLEVVARPESNRFLVDENRLLDRTDGETVSFGDLETVTINATAEASTITIFDTAGDDVFNSFPEFSALVSEQRELIADGFESVIAISRFGDDVANMQDSLEDDLILANSNRVQVRLENRFQHASGFQAFNVSSLEGLDRLEFRKSGVAPRSITVSPSAVAVDLGEEQPQFAFDGVQLSTFLGAAVNTDQVEVVGGEEAETLVIDPSGSALYGAGFRHSFDETFRNFESTTESEGQDRIIYRDTTGDEQLTATEGVVEITGHGASHRFEFFDTMNAVSNSGGEDNATLSNATANLRLFGGWTTTNEPTDEPTSDPTDE